MDEYERLERELADEYAGYVTRFRNLAWLEAQVCNSMPNAFFYEAIRVVLQLDAHAKKEASRAEASARALRRLQKRLQASM
jgi:hypothetical protein